MMHSDFVEIECSWGGPHPPNPPPQDGLEVEVAVSRHTSSAQSLQNGQRKTPIFTCAAKSSRCHPKRGLTLRGIPLDSTREYTPREETDE